MSIPTLHIRVHIGVVSTDFHDMQLHVIQVLYSYSCLLEIASIFSTNFSLPAKCFVEREGLWI